jgi:hypothetical protein
MSGEATRLSKLLFEAREMIDMFGEVVRGTYRQSGS